MEEEIALISDELEAILSLPRSQPILVNIDKQVRQHVHARFPKRHGEFVWCTPRLWESALEYLRWWSK